MAYAGGKKKHRDSEQEIEQEQANEQKAQCVTGTISLLNCNNVGLGLISKTVTYPQDNNKTSLFFAYFLSNN